MQYLIEEIVYRHGYNHYHDFPGRGGQVEIPDGIAARYQRDEE
jgi:hypothetical protein